MMPVTSRARWSVGTAIGLRARSSAPRMPRAMASAGTCQRRKLPADPDERVTRTVGVFALLVATAPARPIGAGKTAIGFVGIEAALAVAGALGAIARRRVTAAVRLKRAIGIGPTERTMVVHTEPPDRALEIAV